VEQLWRMAPSFGVKPLDASEALRQRMLAGIPRWYSPYGHLAGTIGVGVGTLALALAKISNVRALELLTIPAAFVFANLVEWWAHKHVMHRRRRFMPVLYDRHTPEHHRVYRYEDMAIRSARELRLVLIPAMGVLGIVLLSAPAALLAALLVNANVGWLFLMSSALYVVGYELTHLCYHLPENSLVYRIPLVRALREHHARHHMPSLMQNFNFNVTVPLGDLLFGTIAPSERVQAALSRARNA
jgi:hypothetical protein